MHANIDSPLTVFADLYTVEEVFLAGLNLQRLNAGDDIEFLRNEIRRQKTRFRFVGGWGKFAYEIFSDGYPEYGM